MQNKGVGFKGKVNLIDRETGKSVYNNSDVVDMAAFSLKRCGTGAVWNKIEYATIELRCTKCGYLNSRFFHQRNGFWCHKCNDNSDGIDLKLDDIKLGLVSSCEQQSGNSNDQANCLDKIFKEIINKHNNQYKYLKYGEPTIFHKALYRIKPFIKGLVLLTRELFKKEDGQ